MTAITVALGADLVKDLISDNSELNPVSNFPTRERMATVVASINDWVHVV